MSVYIVFSPFLTLCLYYSMNLKLCQDLFKIFFNWLVFLHAPERGAGVLATPIALGLNLCHRAVPPVPALTWEVSFGCLLSFDDLMIPHLNVDCNTFFKIFLFCLGV